MWPEPRFDRILQPRPDSTDQSFVEHSSSTLRLNGSLRCVFRVSKSHFFRDGQCRLILELEKLSWEVLRRLKSLSASSSPRSLTIRHMHKTSFKTLRLNELRFSSVSLRLAVTRTNALHRRSCKLITTRLRDTIYKIGSPQG